MKAESTALASQRDTTCQEGIWIDREREGESRHRPWIFFLVFCCSSNVFVSVFRRISCESGVTPFERSPENGAGNFRPVSHFSGECLTVVFSSTRLPANTFQLKFSPYFRLLSERGTYPFSVVPHMLRRSGTPLIFLVIFNYRCHSAVTGWPTMGAFAWLTQFSWLFCSVSVCFFFLFFLLSFLL